MPISHEPVFLCTAFSVQRELKSTVVSVTSLPKFGEAIETSLFLSYLLGENYTHSIYIYVYCIHTVDLGVPCAGVSELSAQVPQEMFAVLQEGSAMLQVTLMHLTVVVLRVISTSTRYMCRIGGRSNDICHNFPVMCPPFEHILALSPNPQSSYRGNFYLF